MRLVSIFRATVASVGVAAGARWSGAQAAPDRRPDRVPDGVSVPTPSQVTGLAVGADRTLADWAQITGYFAALARVSPYVRVDTLGATTQGRPFVMATITAPANQRRLAELRAGQARLADPRGLAMANQARLVATQPAVVMISCNIHSTEIGASQMAMELAYRLATVDTLQRALDSVVVLLVPSMNPDGEQMVVDWYRRGVGTPFEGGPLPYLYHPYTGHDNNRDWYMVTQRETRLVTDVLYRGWFPEVFYDVHQQGTDGMRITLPPHTDPIDPNVDPLIVRGINHIGAEMGLALESRGKTGVGSGATYDLWWHGGARSTPTRHNMVGLLSEAASARIATPITLRPTELRGVGGGAARVNLPNPWPGGTWRLRDIMDDELIASEALVKMLARQRGDYVSNFVALGRKEVALGAAGGPWAYVLPAGQADVHAVARLVEVLRVGGVDVERATAPFAAGGHAYAAGSYVVPMAQPYRAHAKDLLEVQHFPRIEAYPGGPPQRPYDVAGWTLPYQFGVRVDAVDSAFTAASAPVAGIPTLGTLDRATLAGCELRGAHGPRGMRVLDAGNTACYRYAFAPMSGRGVRLGSGTAAIDVRAVPRVGLYRPWTANMDEGWSRWVLEQYGVPYTTLTDSAARAGNLRARYDVVIVPDMPLREAREGMSAKQVPAPYAGGLGDAGIAELRAFAEAGGTLVLVDRATELASGPLGMPVRRIVPPRAGDDAGEANDTTSGGSLYAPGSILRVLVDRAHPLASGMGDTAAVYFTNSTTLDVTAVPGARVIARYPAQADSILMSGFLSGGARIAGQAALAEAPLGRGRVVLFGFRPLYRGQSIGTFKLLFNALLDAGASRR